MSRLRSGTCTPFCSETGHNRLHRVGNQPLGEPRRLVESNLLEPRFEGAWRNVPGKDGQPVAAFDASTQIRPSSSFCLSLFGANFAERQVFSSTSTEL
jgi:hypothetical protein